jgi:hypothetical protein
MHGTHNITSKEGAIWTIVTNYSLWLLSIYSNIFLLFFVLTSSFLLHAFLENFIFRYIPVVFVLTSSFLLHAFLQNLSQSDENFPNGTLASKIKLVFQSLEYMRLTVLSIN